MLATRELPMNEGTALTGDEVDFLAAYPLRLKNGEAVNREETLRYIELADRFFIDAIERLESVLAKNREFADAEAQLVKRVRSLSDQNTVLASMVYKSMQDFMVQGTA